MLPQLERLLMGKLWIKKEKGRFTGQSRIDLKELFDSFEDGWHTIEYAPKEAGYRPSRYKYYFDSLMKEILAGAGRYYRLVNSKTGEVREPSNVQEMHHIMKSIYNPIVLLTDDGKVRVMSGSTTELNTTEFIEGYQEQIIIDHSGPPYNLEITDYDTWRQVKAQNK